MALRRLRYRDSAVLRAKAVPVRLVTGAVLQLLDDMAETMYDAGGVGLAAPQVGIGRRLVVADPGEQELLHLINPRFLDMEGDAIDVEGCLSIPGVYGEVPRARRVVAAALDRGGREIRFEAEGLLARILQHEIDHLDGILFVDRALRLLDADEFKERCAKNEAGEDEKEGSGRGALKTEET